MSMVIFVPPACCPFRWRLTADTRVKPRSGGRNQNGQPVEYGEPLFILG